MIFAKTKKKQPTKRAKGKPRESLAQEEEEKEEKY
jgi:hypothetical protein